MKKLFTFKVIAVVMIAFLLSGVSVNKVFGQRWTDYTWADYKTKFKVPSDFNVTSSSGEEWSGSNNDIALSIYPRKGENLSQREMDKAILKWAQDSQVESLTEIIDLDKQKLNGYWGVMVEGKKDGWPVALMLIIDPDYPDTSMYVWVSYAESKVDIVLEILYSFIPS